MTAPFSSPPIRSGTAPDGSVIYTIDLAPDLLPPVLSRDLEEAWDAARQAALRARASVARGFRFLQPDGSYTDLALADRDARCWAGAIDRHVGLHTTKGLSLCLRLLALVDLLARVRWAEGLFRRDRGGIELDRTVLRIAAIAPLTETARFDESQFATRLGRGALASVAEAPALSPPAGFTGAFA